MFEVDKVIYVVDENLFWFGVVLLLLEKIWFGLVVCLLMICYCKVFLILIGFLLLGVGWVVISNDRYFWMWLVEVELVVVYKFKVVYLYGCVGGLVCVGIVDVVGCVVVGY